MSQALAGQGATEVPLVAVRRAPADAAAVPVWSLLLPAHWVPPIWHALVFAGARPAGLRECAALSFQHYQGVGLRASQGHAEAARGISGVKDSKYFMSMGATCRTSWYAIKELRL